MDQKSQTAAQLRDDALAIWRAGVTAVAADRLVRQQVRVDEARLVVGSQHWPLNSIRRILVVGAGKAGAGMAAGVEQAIGESLARDKQLTGWVNVPADCVQPLRWIKLHAARPAGVNEPTADGVHGAEEILRLVQDAEPDDLCLCLISGGGSALLPAPVPGVSLEDKQQLTRILSGLGANIQQLNTVRKQLSRIKGGGLARACRARRLVTLIISDVLGDPLDVIASGPTVADSARPRDALAVLEQLAAREAGVPESVFSHLNRSLAANEASPATEAAEVTDTMPQVTNLVIGNNAVAVEASAVEARRLGYLTTAEPGTRLEGAAEEIGRALADRGIALRRRGGRRCLVTGGEPTVKLAPPDRRGRGGRNQQLVLAALDRLLQSTPSSDHASDDLVVLSGGTDGEDGPTNAAGAWIDAELCQRLATSPLDPQDFLDRNDAYPFFAAIGGLLITGPTHTNVCDIRVVVTADSATHTS